MKLILILICTAGLLTSFGEGYSQNTKLSLEFKNSSIESILNYIESHTEYSFMYDNRKIDISREVNIDVKNQTVEAILDQLFDKGVNYQMIGKHIIITPKEDQSGVVVQQQKTISGKVTDSSGSALPGVTVLVKGTSSGTITGTDGSYSLANLPPDATLVFSFVGMKMEEIKVEGKPFINVTMEEETVGIREVVAIGYGTVRKRDLTGSVTSVSSNDFSAQPVQNLSDMIQGRAAGVTVTSQSGDAAVNTKIRIRGNNSINGYNDPLYIIDGIPMGTFNPNDVASIEILKDASATAIYGSRGANGVVLVTTKRGKIGTPTVELQVTEGFSSSPKSLDLMDAATYAEFYNKYNGVSYFSADEIRGFKANGGTDWQKAIMQTGLSQNYQASVSGGSETAKYFISGNYINNSATLINNDAKYYGIRSNFDLKIGSRFTSTIDISARSSKVHNSGTGLGANKSPLWNCLMWSPTAPVFNEDGSYNRLDPIGAKALNPYMEVKEKNDNAYGTNISVNGILTYKIIDGLKISAQPAIEKSSTESRNFSNQYITQSGDPSAYRSYTESLNWQITGLLTYDKLFKDKHALNVVLGSEFWSNQYNYFTASASNFTDNRVLWYNLQNGTNKYVTSGYSESSLESFFARANYIFNSKYYLTGSIRADGSSKFRGDNQFGYFPSAAAGWVASEEEFIKNLNFFSYLKLRGSYGITGSQAVGSYSTIASMGMSGYNYGTLTDYPGYVLGSPANPGLKWEETAQFDIGLDATFLNDKFSVTLDYYSKKTTGLLTAKTLPAYSGGGSTMINLGEMKNSGFDASFTYLISGTGRDLQGKMTLNVSTLNNKVIDLGDMGTEFVPSGSFVGVELPDSPMIVREGERLGSFYGYKFLGLWGANEEAEAAKYGQKPGDNKYLDVDHNYELDGKDKMIIGNYLPKVTWGFNTSLSYKNLDFNLLIEGFHGRDVLNYSYMLAGTVIGESSSITLKEAANYWTTENQNTIWTPKSSTRNERPNSTKWVQNGGFLKLRNISVGYTLPDIVNGQLRVSLSAQNLFTITDYKGRDPEVSSNSYGNDFNGGVDYGIYPMPRIYTIGVSYKF
ncbi:MAG: TonB-dependent receptor [Mangrovibacterium sp.]